MTIDETKKKAIGLLIVCLAVTSGCSSHIVRYNADSSDRPSGNQETVPPAGSDASRPTAQLHGRTFPYSGETIDPGALPQTHQPAWPGAPFVADPPPNTPGTPPYAGIRYFEPGSGFSESGAQYGHNYGGAEGFGPDNGPVTGFGSGNRAESVNPDPETWAKAYLGEETATTPSPTTPDSSATPDSSQDFVLGEADYGHEYHGVPGQGPGHGPVTGFGSGSADPVLPDPETWARGYLRDDNAESLPLERVDEGTIIAKADPMSPPTTRDDHGRATPSLPGFAPPTVRSQDLGFAQPTSTSSGRIADVYFDFDSWKITETGKHILEADADWLRTHPEKTVTIEGHCDPRGTQSYNLVLGKKRAEAAKTYLVDLGIAAERIKVVSYGEERPFCTAATETCYKQNRRGHFVIR